MLSVVLENGKRVMRYLEESPKLQVSLLRDAWITVDPGSMQKYVAISPSAAMIRKPQNLSWEQAAAIPLVYMTVYGCLVDVGHLPFRPSETEKGRNSVLILGGSGGAGSQAIQLAKMMGFNVVTSCSKASAEMVKKLGADEVSPSALK
jgi:NADPH:quinone reductase-like Zn-dependent oxidoreductase